MTFNMDDYIDVPARIALMAAKYPESSLQSKLTPHFDGQGNMVGWLCKAYAYRTPDDPKPGIGHAFEPVPGKTPYTKDSEAMNAETSAWGRAIVALGFETKKIASAQEVQARHPAQAAQASQPPSHQPEAQPIKEGVQTAPFTVATLEGPNANGWYELVTAAGLKFATKKQELLGGVAAGDNVMLSWKETTKGQYVNRYIEQVTVLPAGQLDSDDIPF